MGCTSAKQVSAVPSDEEGRGKAYSNGDVFTDEYKKGVEEVKYMRGDENRVNARNQENLEKSNVQHKGKQQKEVPAPNIKSKGETTVRRRRRKMGHSTEAPRSHPHREPHRVCACVCVRVPERALNQCLTNGVLTGHFMLV
uniref:Uncharacterized protein n=1 Tax=Oreochromis aureus TaxID=47969 RepID=A0AAZ1WV16_OREAU